MNELTGIKIKDMYESKMNEEMRKYGRVFLYETKPKLDEKCNICLYCNRICKKQCASHTLLVYMYPDGSVKEYQMERWWLG